MKIFNKDLFNQINTYFIKHDIMENIFQINTKFVIIEFKVNNNILYLVDFETKKEFVIMKNLKKNFKKKNFKKILKNTLDQYYTCEDCNGIYTPKRGNGNKHVECNKQKITRNCDPNRDCAICLETLYDTVAMKTKCNHYFHKECLKKNEQFSSKCPLCRTELEEPNTENSNIFGWNYDELTNDERGAVEEVLNTLPEHLQEVMRYLINH